MEKTEKIILDAGSSEPLYQQLAHHLLDRIISGKLQPGDKLPSENEMLKTYNVGRQTIRSALSLLVGEGFLSKSQGKGTFVTGGGGAKQARNIEVLLDMTDAYFIPYYVHGISDVLSESNSNFLISDTRDSDEVLCCLLENIAVKGSSGILLQYTGPAEPDKYGERFIRYLDMLVEKGLPIVILDGHVDHPGIPCLTVDDYGGGHRAAEHLAAFGHKKTAMINLGRHRDSRLRYEGFSAGAKFFGMDTPHELSAADLWEEELLELVRGGVTGVFAYNDVAALRCILILRKEGYRVPEDVSVIGFDDTQLAASSDPPLTALAHPKEKISRDAAKLLLNMIDTGNRKQENRIYPVDLSMRESVGPARSC